MIIHLLLLATLRHNVRCLILVIFKKSESNYDKFDHFSGQYCYEKKVEVIPVNTTTHRVVSETSTEPCWFCLSWDHPFQRVVTKKRLKPVITIENVTRTTLGGF